MPTTKKKTPPATAPAAVPPSKTSHLFSSRKSNDRSPVTHEGLAADLEAFRKAGGKIEVLGVTRTLLRIEPGDTQPAPAAPAASTSRRR